MIYCWVKFDGHKQSWVADQLDLNQSTVSRIVDRYERWVAHGGPAQQGALNRDERLRAQLWLNYERNEWIITSALRLAGDMEHMSDTSKSTTKHYRSEPSREIEVRTENSIRDRTATASRYLRLAHLVGKNQLELIHQLDLPALEPFTLDEHEHAQALADANPKYVEVSEFGAGLPTPPSPRPQVSRLANLDTLTRSVEDEPLSTSIEPAPENLQIPNPQTELSSAPPAAPVPRSPSPMHTMHNSGGTESHLTSTPTVTSLEIAPHKKPVAHAYAISQNPPEPTDRLDPILNATAQQPLPPIRMLPIHLPLGS
jgi:hypothetical protein